MLRTKVAAVAAVVVNPAAAAPPEVVVDKVADAQVAGAVVVRVVAVVDVPPVVAVDKVVAGEAVAQVAVAADFPVVAEDREVEEAVVDVPLVVAGAAETVNQLSSGGASRIRGVPLFY